MPVSVFTENIEAVAKLDELEPESRRVLRVLCLCGGKISKLLVEAVVSRVHKAENAYSVVNILNGMEQLTQLSDGKYQVLQIVKDAELETLEAE